MDLKEARQLIEAWRQECNESRHHASLEDRTPSEFASQVAARRAMHELIQRKCEERQENRIVKMLRESQLPLENTLYAFDTKRLPAKAARQMRSLLDGGFLDRNENVLGFGNPGSGRTHMMQAISQELVRQGRRMLFTTCEMLVQDLLIAKRDLKLSRLIKRYSRYEGMVIDDPPCTRSSGPTFFI